MSLWSWNLLWYVSDLFLVWWLYLGPKSVATNVKCWNGNGDRSGLCLLWIEPLFHIRFTSFFLHLIHHLKRLACFILFSTYSSVKSCFDINLDGVELASCVVQFWSTFCPKILLKTLYGWHCYVGQNPLWWNLLSFSVKKMIWNQRRDPWSFFFSFTRGVENKTQSTSNLAKYYMFWV